MNDSTMGSIDQIGKTKQVLKQKLSYEWKNIFRLLRVQDKEGVGIVSRPQFDASLNQVGCFLSSEELRKVSKLYGNAQNQINYEQMSKDLGLHNQSFNFFQNTQSRI